MHKEDTVAFQPWNLNSKQFLSVVGIPYSNFIHRGSSKDLRESVWEGNIVNSLVMASVPQFWSQGVGVYPVYVRLVGPAEEMSIIASQCQ